MMRKLLAGLMGCVAMANSQAITVKIDYTYDAGFFGVGTQARATLEQAAADLSQALTLEANATLSAVGTSHFEAGNGAGAVDWTLNFNSPSDSSIPAAITDFSPFTTDTFVVYAGAQPLDTSTELGEGAPLSVTDYPKWGGADEADTVAGLLDAIALSNGIMSRGSGPTIFSVVPTSPIQVGSTVLTESSTTLNEGAIAGFLSVSPTTTAGSSWHLDYHTLPGTTEFDLYSVVLHEMIHALGFGSSATWNSFRKGQDWAGPNVVALLGSGTNAVDASNAHVNTAVVGDSTTLPSQMPAGMETVTKVVVGGSQPAVMTASLPPGTRRTLTVLDLAFLKDLGYGNAIVAAPTPATTPFPAATPTPIPAPTPLPAPPLSPALAGKPPKTTSSSKITLGGTLISPGAYVVYKIGTGSFVKAKGGAAWKAVIKLKPGKNIIYIASFDPVSQETSNVKKITITRK